VQARPCPGGDIIGEAFLYIPGVDEAAGGSHSRVGVARASVRKPADGGPWVPVPGVAECCVDAVEWSVVSNVVAVDGSCIVSTF
jgi:hypothetical protein